MSITFPTLYEHYTSGGVVNGLSADQPYFTLNNRNITIYSGSIHYFRIPKSYWRDRLRKARAAGLNAVDTYVPWNLHEPLDGVYDFGRGGSDFQEFLDVKRFLQIAQEEDLFAIVRPGPYICSEWEFGGFPSWLLREDGIKFRTSERSYMRYVARYFRMLLPILAMLQFTRGGPIIAFQVENEYGSTYFKGRFVPDKEYLRQIRDIMLNSGIVELLLTSDGVGYNTTGTLPGSFLMTANLNHSPERQLTALRNIQPDRPLMVMEFWIGWFSRWSQRHITIPCDFICRRYERILRLNASVNLYMFHGGTSFGFMNGANLLNAGTNNSGFIPDITSYDYDAPLTERGEYTEKYLIIKTLIAKYNPIKTKTPRIPKMTEAVKYPSVLPNCFLSFNQIVDAIPEKIPSISLVPMEHLPINGKSGQSYGYIVYRKVGLDLPNNAILTIVGHVCDTVMVLINGKLISKPLQNITDLDGFGYWRQANSSIILTTKDLKGATLDLVVENWGRVNFGYVHQFEQFKGLWQGPVLLDGLELSDWQIVPLEFKKSWTRNQNDCHVYYKVHITGPAMYMTTMYTESPQDTYLDMRRWGKGIVIVNGFVLGRYASIGPQQALYLPGPLLKRGHNEIAIFEHFRPASEITFSSQAIYGDNSVRGEQEVITEQPHWKSSTKVWSVGICVFFVNNLVVILFCILYRRRHFFNQYVV